MAGALSGACFELHTFSSLNEQFLKEYAGSMDACNEAIVFFSHHALALKGLPELKKEVVKEYFDRADLRVFDSSEELATAVEQEVLAQEKPVFLLLMSSGTFDGIDWNTLSSRLKQ